MKKSVKSRFFGGIFSTEDLRRIRWIIRNRRRERETIKDFKGGERIINEEEEKYRSGII